MIYSPVSLFADHLSPALGTDPVDAALTGNMRFSMSALWVGADTIAAWAGTGFVTAAATFASATFAATASSATKDSV
jgi:hypothetical protein